MLNNKKAASTFPLNAFAIKMTLLSVSLLWIGSYYSCCFSKKSRPNLYTVHQNIFGMSTYGKKGKEPLLKRQNSFRTILPQEAK